MVTERPDSLLRWLDFLKIPDCPCPYEWRGIGILYGVSFGKGWVRMTTDPACPHHGPAADHHAPLAAGTEQ